MKKLESVIKNLNSKRIISLDAESNGLYGQSFAIAAVKFDENGNKVSEFVGRCQIEEEINPWVKDNVLPNIEDIEITHNSYEELLKGLFDYLKTNNDAVVLTHMGHIVESKLIHDAHELGIIGDFEGPYLWYDVCLLFEDSVDSYNKQNNLEVEFKGATHNPLYDVYAAYTAFKDFVKEDSQTKTADWN